MDTVRNKEIIHKPFSRGFALQHVSWKTDFTFTMKPIQMFFITKAGSHKNCTEFISVSPVQQKLVDMLEFRNF